MSQSEYNVPESVDRASELKEALTRNEFQLYYQPKVDLTTGKIVGSEALIRWKHPEKGLVSPAEFIPVAEESGLIIPIGEWVIRTACLQNKAWQDSGLPSMVISVNLSVRQLYQPDLVEMVGNILEETGLSPAYLELEITESMMMDVHYAHNLLKELKELGIKISLDDFGTGYSSLHYLQDLPIDKLKIDQSFIKNSTVDANDATIVKTIIAMAHQLNFEVVAEGVELKDHLIFLQRNLCNEAQGYLFSKPVPEDDFVREMESVELIVPQYGLPYEVSTHKWIQEELRLARQELLDTVKQQQGMITKFIKRDGRFIHTICDGELLNRMGLTTEQVVGRDLDEFLSPDVLEEKITYYERAWNGEEKVTYEGLLNGIYYIASLRPIRRGGEVVEVIGSMVDITDRKQVEESLRISEAKYRLIAENMSDVVKVLDLNGTIQYASPSNETVLGFSEEFYKGRSAFDFIHPDDVTSVKETFMEILSTKLPGQVKLRDQHAQGHWVTLEVKGTPVSDDNGMVSHVVVVARDLSERS